MKDEQTELINNNEILISFSGGRTSAFMCKYLKSKYPDKNFHIVFCNTGKEREETLEFVERCDKEFGLGVVWLEGTFSGEKGENGANSFKVVDFATASRNGEPFEAMIKKYGIPCMKTPTCTRELKKRTISRWLRKNKIKNCWQAVGIRSDEANRINRKTAEKERKFYPLADDIKTNKQFINRWWERQPFNLELKEHQGNCDMCFKKSDRKLFTLINEDPSIINWWMQMELKYGGQEYKFYRKNRTVSQMIEESKKPFRKFKEQTGLSLFEFDLDLEFDCFCKST